jgi:predicted dehydrogenase
MQVVILKSCLLLLVLVLNNACQENDTTRFTGKQGEVRLITLNPGHFHAHLIQSTMYDQVDSTVYVYAPDGPDVIQHLEVVENYNTRPEDPTSWNHIVYTGDDYLEKMIADKKGNVVILAGNNMLKTAYIKRAVDAGLNVLSDKPMAIDPDNFNLLKAAFASAGENSVLLYDMMTARYSIQRIIQGELMRLPGVFGEISKGSPDNPSIHMESIHYFLRYESGTIAPRPPWYFDVRQQGEGIVDVTTHLVDNVQWACFPEEIIDYRSDIDMISARRWPTEITRSQFEKVTGNARFPGYLDEYIENDTVLQVYANGEMVYKLKDITVKIAAKWDFQAPEKRQDLISSSIRGTNASLVIGQRAEQDFRSVLYIEPDRTTDPDDFETVLLREFTVIQNKYPGVELKKLDKSWEVVIPRKYDLDSYAELTKKYMQYLIDGKMPDWEVSNMIARYYTTTSALELAKKEK